MQIYVCAHVAKPLSIAAGRCARRQGPLAMAVQCQTTLHGHRRARQWARSSMCLSRNRRCGCGAQPNSREPRRLAHPPACGEWMGVGGPLKRCNLAQVRSRAARLDSTRNCPSYGRSGTLSDLSLKCQTGGCSDKLFQIHPNLYCFHHIYRRTWSINLDDIGPALCSSPYSVHTVSTWCICLLRLGWSNTYALNLRVQDRLPLLRDSNVGGTQN